MEKKIAIVILDAITSVGKVEQKAAKETEKAVSILEENGIFTETALYDWAISEKYWNAAWPKPRSLWQEVSRQTMAGGRKVKWIVKSRSVHFAWKEKEAEMNQSVSLSLVAGLGRLCARLATAQSRNSKKSGKESGKENGKESGKEKVAKAAAEKAKKEAEEAKAAAEKAKKEAADARKELLVQKAAFESGIIKDKKVKAAKKETDAALAALEEAKTKATTATQERDAKEETLLRIANSVNKASIDAPKEELWTIIQEIKAALSNNTLACTKVKTPQPMP